MMYFKLTWWVFPKIGTPKSSILIGFSIIFTIHFGGPPLFLGFHPDGPVKHWNHNQLQPASASPPRVTRACLPPKCSRPEQQGYRFFGAQGCHPCVKNSQKLLTWQSCGESFWTHFLLGDVLDVETFLRIHDLLLMFFTSGFILGGSCQSVGS